MKSYAFIDIIGIKSAIENGSAAEMLQQFWVTVDVWANSYSEPLIHQNENATSNPDFQATTFSDSVLLTCKTEYRLTEFYKLAKNLKDSIEMRGLACLMIISNNEEIPQPEFPALGGYSEVRQSRRYQKLAGSGDAWVNIFKCEKVISKKMEWHGRYSTYFVGASSLPQGIIPGDQFEESGFTVYAI